MAYQAEISRSNPSCFLFLLDQSGYMAYPFAGSGGRSKADELPTIINRLLASLVIRCSKDEGVRDYFEVGVFGYGARIKPRLGCLASNGPIVPISRLADEPLRVEDRCRRVSDGVGGLVEQSVKFPIWVDPQAKGGTPMTDALRRGHAALSAWVAEHPKAFPPVVFNITAGEATDGDPLSAATQLCSLGRWVGATVQRAPRAATAWRRSSSRRATRHCPRRLRVGRLRLPVRRPLVVRRLADGRFSPVRCRRRRGLADDHIHHTVVFRLLRTHPIVAVDVV